MLRLMKTCAVAAFVASLGFDPVDAGALAAGSGFALGAPAFAVRRGADELGALLAAERVPQLVAA